MLKKIKLSSDTEMLLNLFIPFYAIHSMEQIYFVYGNVLKGYGLSSELIGWILGVFFVTVMAVRPFGGWVLENFGIRRTLVWSSILSLIGCSLLFFKGGVIFLMLGRILTGAAFGVNTMGLFSYQAIMVSEKTRGAFFALIVSAGILPMATLGPLGEWLLIHSHSNLYLAIGAVLSVVCWVFGGRVGAPRISAKKEDTRWGTYRDLLSYRTFLILILTGLLISLVDAVMICVSLLANERGIVASYFLASISATAVVIRVAGARIINVLPREAIIAPMGMLMAGANIFIALKPSNVSFMVAGIVFGVGLGTSWPMFHALVSDTLNVALRPKGMAMALLLYDFGWFVTPLMVGYVSPILGIASTIFVWSSLVLIALALLQFLYWLPLYTNLKSKA